MNPVERAALYAMPLVLGLAEVIGVAMNRLVAPHHYFNPVNDQLVFGVTAGVVALVSLRRREAVAFASLSAIFASATFIYLQARGTLSWQIHAYGLCLWYASLVLSARDIVRERGPARTQALDAAAIKFALPAAIPLLTFFLWLTTQSLTEMYDSYLYSFDGLLPWPVASQLAKATRDSSWLHVLARTTYDGLMAVIGLFICLDRDSNGEFRSRLIGRFLLAAFLGYLFYFLMPGVGPREAIGTLYPHHMLDPLAVPLKITADFSSAPRNVMPSLHATWAYLLLLTAWQQGPAARTFAAFFVAGTLFATLGLGEHYAIDLVVAVPFTLAIDGIASLMCRVRTNRWPVRCAAVGLGMTMGWLIVIRYATESLRSFPVLATLLVLATLIACGWLLFCARRANPSSADSRHSVPAPPLVLAPLGRRLAP